MLFYFTCNGVSGKGGNLFPNCLLLISWCTRSVSLRKLTQDFYCLSRNLVATCCICLAEDISNQCLVFCAVSKATPCAYLQSTSDAAEYGASLEVLAMPRLTVADTEQSGLLEFNCCPCICIWNQTEKQTFSQDAGNYNFAVLWSLKIQLGWQI